MSAYIPSETVWDRLTSKLGTRNVEGMFTPRHESHVTCHVSRVTCPLSHVKYNILKKSTIIYMYNCWSLFVVGRNKYKNKCIVLLGLLSAHFKRLLGLPYSVFLWWIMKERFKLNGQFWKPTDILNCFVHTSLEPRNGNFVQSNHCSIFLICCLLWNEYKITINSQHLRKVSRTLIPYYSFEGVIVSGYNEQSINSKKSMVPGCGEVRCGLSIIKLFIVPGCINFQRINYTYFYNFSAKTQQVWLDRQTATFWHLDSPHWKDLSASVVVAVLNWALW